MNRVLLYSAFALGLAIAACAAPARPSADWTGPTGTGGETDHGEVGHDNGPEGLAFDGSGLDLASLRLSLPRPVSFLPAEVALADQSAVIVSDLLYDGLTEAVGLEGRLRPGLAETWSANEDFTQWWFSLDDRRIEGARVVEYFDQLLDERANPAIAPLLVDVVAVEAVGAAEVRFELAAPNAGFAWLMSGVGLSMVGVDGAPTGRYAIETSDIDQLVLVPDEDSANWPTIEVHWAENDNDAYEMLTLGFVDGAAAPAASLDDAKSRFGFVAAARSISRFYGIDADSPPLVDERAVEAVLHAVDRDGAVGSTAFAVDGPVAPSMAGYGAGGCASACDYQPDLAARLVADMQSSVEADGGGAAPGSSSLSIAYSGDEKQATAEAIAGDLEAAGFAVTLEAKTPSELAEAVATGSADLFALGWLAGAGSIDAVIPQLFASDSPTNLLGFDSAEVDDLIARAAMTADDTARWRLLIEAQRLAMNEGHILPLAVAKSQLVVAPQASALIVRADGSIDIEASQ
ncbi:MAG: hypothetical protein GY724_20470 [Actinomycetia bacterium]|nr:hypothetical protein [Actinomycetes bacterium]MCP5032859.1 hypothetical protein [Actinomycetes bacterium]